MLGKALENFFIRVWVMMKLNLFFLLFSLAGGLVLGIGPAWKSISELFIAYQFDYKEITFSEGWILFKENFKRGNALFWFFSGISAFLAYNLFLSLQVKGLGFLVIDFILIVALLYLFASFQYGLIFDSSYDMSFKNLIKLSFISNFSSFSAFLKVIGGSVGILALTWRYKGLILFGTTALLLMWNYFATKNWREEIEEKLE